MGGSGGGSTFKYRSPEALSVAVRKAEDDSSVKQFEAELAGTLSELLGAYNSRDAQTVQERLNAIRAALQGAIEGTFDSLFGGSVAKHTYVDGLSDIDSLILLNSSDLENHSPQRALEKNGRHYQGRNAYVGYGNTGANGSDSGLWRWHSHSTPASDKGC